MIIPSAPIHSHSRRKTGQTSKHALRGMTIGCLALFLTLGGTAKATTITFATDPLPANNSDLPANFGSNIAADGNGFITTDGTGATPNIALLWAPTGGTNGVGPNPDKDVLEFHSASTFSGFGLTVPVLQLDVDTSTHGTNVPANPTLDFILDAGYALKFISLEIGNATDQNEPDYGWTLRLIRLADSTEVASYTTALMGPGDFELATFNYTGDAGQSYRLLFDDYGNAQERTGIDNVKFSQIQVPEPTSLALFALSGMGLMITRGMKRKR